EERVRDLGEDACAVAGLSLSAHGTAVLEVLEGGQREVDDVATGAAPHGGNKRDATRVVLISGVIQPLLGRHGTGLRHHTSSWLGARQSRRHIMGASSTQFFRAFSLPRKPLSPE